MPLDDSEPKGPLPILSEPIKGGGIDLTPGNCVGCGGATFWYVGQMMHCEKCQTIWAYRAALNVRKTIDGRTLIQAFQHSDDYLRFNCLTCPSNGRKCSNPERFHSYFSQVQGFQSSKFCYNRKYRIARGWATPMQGECKCNGCNPGGH